MTAVRAGAPLKAAACGVPILSDEWEGLDHFFKPGSEIIVAHTTGEAIHALEMPHEQIARIARASRERAGTGNIRRISRTSGLRAGGWGNVCRSMSSSIFRRCAGAPSFMITWPPLPPYTLTTSGGSTCVWKAFRKSHRRPPAALPLPPGTGLLRTSLNSRGWGATAG